MHNSNSLETHCSHFIFTQGMNFDTYFQGSNRALLESQLFECFSLWDMVSTVSSAFAMSIVLFLLRKISLSPPDQQCNVQIQVMLMIVYVRCVFSLGLSESKMPWVNVLLIQIPFYRLTLIATGAPDSASTHLYYCQSNVLQACVEFMR